MKDKLNFTVGPVMMDPETKEIGSMNNPYFRNEEFSQIMLENQGNFLKTLNAPASYSALFMTGSGTLGMEAVVHSIVNDNDYALVINGGSFGQRFVDLLKLYDKKIEEIKPGFGNTITLKDLDEFKDSGITKLFVNLHETSSGVLYDLDMLTQFCQANGIMLIVDAISAYIADPIDLVKHPIDVLITGSQKALALPPGLSLIALSEAAQKEVKNNVENRRSLYLDLNNAMVNMERGQTPFTPAVGIILQLHHRLSKLAQGGIKQEQEMIRLRAKEFRTAMIDLGLQLFGSHQSNALTTIEVADGYSAKEVVDVLSHEFNIWVTPSGGAYQDRLFRVGHIGYITQEQQNELINALKTLHERGILK